MPLNVRPRRQDTGHVPQKQTAPTWLPIVLAVAWTPYIVLGWAFSIFHLDGCTSASCEEAVKQVYAWWFLSLGLIALAAIAGGVMLQRAWVGAAIWIGLGAISIAVANLAYNNILG